MSSIQLEELPVELFDEITQYLSLKECVRLERVSSKWRTAMRKEWRRKKNVRLKKYFVEETYFNGVISTAAFEEFAIKIHPHVETINLTNKINNVPSQEDEFKLGQIAVFLKKLSELSTPKLTTLKLVLSPRDETGRSINDNEIYQHVIVIVQSIPLNLQSLILEFDCDSDSDHSLIIKYFCDRFCQRTFAQLRSLKVHVSCVQDEYDCRFRMDASNTPNLKQLMLATSYDRGILVDNLHRLNKLEELAVHFGDPKDQMTFLEQILNDNCEFRHGLKKLRLAKCLTDTRSDILAQIGCFSALELLQLPHMFFDVAQKTSILRSIGQGCANLRTLYYDAPVGKEGLSGIARSFPNLCVLRTNQIKLEDIETLRDSLSTESCLEIQCWNGPTEAHVQLSGLLNSHPKVLYTCRNVSKIFVR